MSHSEHLLNLLCYQPETLRKAKALLREALIKTSPGTGFDIGPFKSGLPAICAYIASQKLQNNDVSRIAAQEASCLSKADFEKTYYTVDAAICGERKYRRKASDVFSGRVSYDSLISKHKLPLTSSRVLPTLLMAEKAVLMHPSYSPSFDEDWLKAIVFWYVCKIIKGEDMFPPSEYAEQHRIPNDVFTTTVQTVRKAVSPIKDKIRQHIKESRPAKVQARISEVSGSSKGKQKETSISARSSPAKSPSKSRAAVRELPVGSPSKRMLPEDSVEPQDSAEDPDSPHKRRRTVDDSPSSTLGAAPPTPPDSTSGTPTAPRAESTPSHFPHFSSRDISLEPLPDYASAYGPTHGSAHSFPHPHLPLSHVRTQRFRPAYTDHRQWCQCDHTLRLLKDVGEKHREEMTRLYGNPLRKEAMEA